MINNVFKVGAYIKRRAEYCTGLFQECDNVVYRVDYISLDKKCSISGGHSGVLGAQFDIKQFYLASGKDLPPINILDLNIFTYSIEDLFELESALEDELSKRAEVSKR